MSATILTFPAGQARPRPTRISDLPDGAKALVITVERGRFAVSVKPALTQTERQARSFFVTAEKARQFARRMSIKRPRLFQLIVDDLPKPRPTLDEIMGLAPAGRDGTA